jgi:hypothetical protein
LNFITVGYLIPKIIVCCDSRNLSLFFLLSFVLLYSSNFWNCILVFEVREGKWREESCFLFTQKRINNLFLLDRLVCWLHVCVEVRMQVGWILFATSSSSSKNGRIISSKWKYRSPLQWYYVQLSPRTHFQMYQSFCRASSSCKASSIISTKTWRQVL